MGYLYRPKLKGSTKEDPRFGRIWWIKYYVNGNPIRETTGAEKESEARRFLKAREGRVAMGQPTLPRTDRIRYEEVAGDLRKHYRTTGARNTEEAEFRLRHLNAFFANRRIAAIGPADTTQYAAQRQERGASNGTINRELAVLSRMLRLAYEQGKLLRLPVIHRLQESDPRQGFFGEVEFLAVHENLPEPVRPVVTFAYITGWRGPSEILSLTWAQVDFRVGVVRLEPGTTKNREARTFPMFPELRALLEGQRGYTERIQRERGCIIPWVFHRDGTPIRSYRRSWQTACRLAGQPGRIPHDLRRTAVRNMVRKGIPERVAMQLTGHKTRSVFERYNIVAEGDLREAATRLTGTFAGTSAHFRLDARPINV